MKLYAFSGLGADHRVYHSTNLNAELEVVPWLPPENNESLENYAQRLAETIDAKEDYGLIGMSFGGMIVMEIAKILHPTFTVVVSTSTTKYELPYALRIIGKTGIIPHIPSLFFTPPKPVMRYFFSTPKQTVLNDIVDDSDPVFTRWAVNAIANWKNTQVPKNLFRIHGSNDRLLPKYSASHTHVIQGGGHFMIVDRAQEVSNLINQHITSQIKKP